VSLLLSIIICTRNRAESLRQTLEALGGASVRPEWTVEVVVADNGSTDGTAAVAQDAVLPHMKVRYLYEPLNGKSHALNTAVSGAHGDILLFTDDDVIVDPEWIEHLVEPLLRGVCDAVVGRVDLASHLHRPWLTEYLRGMLANIDMNTGRPLELVGANMALRRSVLERVRRFDTDLGPGALGLGEDTLFGWQVAEAGFEIRYVPQALVRHHLEGSRLLRSRWLISAARLGRTRGYLRYHWEHHDIEAARLKWLWLWTKLHLRRLVQPPPPLDSEGCVAWEMSYVQQMEMCRQFSIERRRPRHYERRGLTKLHRNAAAAAANNLAAHDS
jgi:glycosyltransferase involved in cell wall biosynthesis